MRTLILVIAFLIPSFAVADDRAVLAIQGQDCSSGQTCAISRGSGVAVGRTQSGNLLVLTAAHVVRNTRNTTVYVGNGWQPATVQVVTRPDPNWDLALVEVQYAQPWPCVQLVRDVLGIERSEVTVSGYAGGVTYVHRRGLLGGHTDKYWVWWNGAPPQEGTSGGAVIINGQLGAIISGKVLDGTEQGVGQSPAAIRTFLETCSRRRGITIMYSVPQVQAPAAVVTIPNPAPGPPPNQQIPNPATGPNQSKEIAELKAELAKLQTELAAVRDRGITVELRDADTKQVKARTFAPGEPIRLQLPSHESSSTP